MSASSARMRTMFRLIKGAPITVLFALLHLGGEAGLMELCKLTTLSDKTVDKALQTLKDAGLVTRTHYHTGWVLTRGGFQLPLELAQHFVTPRGDFGDFPKLLAAEQANFGDFPTSEIFRSTTTESLTQDSFENRASLAEVVVAPQNSEVLEALRRAGIGEPTLSQLAKDPHLTADFVAGHDAMRRERGQPTGLLITRLRSHEELPAAYLKPPCPICGKRGKHARDCRASYTAGDFAEFIEH